MIDLKLTENELLLLCQVMDSINLRGSDNILIAGDVITKLDILAKEHLTEQDEALVPVDDDEDDIVRI